MVRLLGSCLMLTRAQLWLMVLAIVFMESGFSDSAQVLLAVHVDTMWRVVKTDSLCDAFSLLLHIFTLYLSISTAPLMKMNGSLTLNRHIAAVILLYCLHLFCSPPSSWVFLTSSFCLLQVSLPLSLRYMCIFWACLRASWCAVCVKGIL